MKKIKISDKRKNMVIICLMIITLCTIFSACSIAGIEITKSNGEEVEGSLENNQGNIVTKTTTSVTFKRYYTKTNTKKTETVNIEAGNVGLNQAQFSEKYKDWTVESFSSDLIVLSKTIDSYPKGYYIITVNDETKEKYIAVYSFDEDGNKNIVEQTNTPIELLDSTAAEEIQKGIVVQSEDEMYNILQNYAE